MKHVRRALLRTRNTPNGCRVGSRMNSRYSFYGTCNLNQVLENFAQWCTSDGPGIAMGKISAETCSICHENLSKYRCPRCSAPYCSLACNKAHRSGVSSVDGEQANPPCTGKRALSGHERHPDSKSNSQTARSNVVGSDRRDDGDEGDGVGLSKRPRIANAVDTAGGDAVVEAVTTACVRKGRDQWRGGREDREEEEWQMSADQRSRLLGCMWLKAALRDPKLQGLLVRSNTDTQTSVIYESCPRVVGKEAVASRGYSYLSEEVTVCAYTCNRHECGRNWHECSR